MAKKSIIGEKCSLVPLRKRDSENWVKWYNDIHISLPESNVYDILTLSTTQDWVKYNMEKDDHVFTIIDNANQIPVGKIELEQEPENKRGTFGIIIGEKDYWGRGFGKEATQLLLDFAFNELGLHSMMLGVYSFNKRAHRLYKSIGFKEIGRKREYQALGGRRFDMILMDMLSTEFGGS